MSVSGVHVMVKTKTGELIPMIRYPSTLKYAQLDQRTKDSYLHWRTQALQAEQAAVDLDALPEPFGIQAFLGLQPRLRRFDPAAMAQVLARLLYYMQRLPPFDDIRRLYLARDGRNLLLNRDMRAAQIKREREFQAVIAPAAALEGQLRLPSRTGNFCLSLHAAPPPLPCAPPHWGLQRVCSRLRRLFRTRPPSTSSRGTWSKRQRRAQAELRRHALAARQAQPRRYRRHPAAHARTWQPRQVLSQLTACLPKRQRNRLSVNLAMPLAATPVTPPELSDSPASAIAPTFKTDYADSDAASAASTVDLLAALLTLVRFVRSTLAPGRPGYTRTLNRHTQETQRLLPSAATDRWPRTSSAMGRWSCAPRDCRKVSQV
jgi:hypothetical protein